MRLALSMRRIERWRNVPAGGTDLRAGPKTTPAHALTDKERKAIVEIATSPEYRNVSVRQIVPRLADKGVYVASEWRRPPSTWRSADSSSRRRAGCLTCGSYSPARRRRVALRWSPCWMARWS